MEVASCMYSVWHLVMQIDSLVSEQGICGLAYPIDKQKLFNILHIM